MAISIEHIRQQAETIASRINSDALFKAQILNDPEATLAAAGLSAQALLQFENKGEIPESEGFATCSPITCVYNTICENTW